MYFQAKIQRMDIDDTVVKEEHLVDAESFTEVEEKLVREYGVTHNDVLAIRRSPIAELFHEDDAGDFYRAKVVQTSTGDNGKEKEVKWYFGLRAVSTGEATSRVLAQLAQGYDGFKLQDIVKTRIVDVVE